MVLPLGAWLLDSTFVLKDFDSCNHQADRNSGGNDLCLALQQCHLDCCCCVLSISQWGCTHSFFDLRAERAREKKHRKSRERVAQWMGKMPDETSLSDVLPHSLGAHAAVCALACVWHCPMPIFLNQGATIVVYSHLISGSAGTRDIVISHTVNSSYTLASACREISPFSRRDRCILFFKVDWPHRDAWSKEATDALWELS